MSKFALGRAFVAPAGLICLAIVSSPLRAADDASDIASKRAETPRSEAPTAVATQKPKAEIPKIDLFEGLRARKLAVKAEGTGTGEMTLTISNRTSHALRVVLPPGLVASSATAQMGGMGGMMGGMGGGMMGGGMGGGMMGGMGGGMMGGMGGGMGQGSGA